MFMRSIVYLYHSGEGATLKLETKKWIKPPLIVIISGGKLKNQGRKKQNGRCVIITLKYWFR